MPHLIATVQRLARAVHGDVSLDALCEADLAAAPTALDRARVEAREAARREIEAVSAAAMAGYTRAEIESWPQKEQAARAVLAATATPAERADWQFQAGTILGVLIGLAVIAGAAYALWQRVKAAARDLREAAS